MPTTQSSSIPSTSRPTVDPTTSTTIPQPAESIYKVAFFNASVGYGLFQDFQTPLCGLSVALTTNGGQTFSTMHSVATDQCDAGSITFDDVGDGFVYGPDLFVSHDGGVTWGQVPGFSNVVSVVPLGSSVWVLDDSCSGPQTDPTCQLELSESGTGGRSWSEPQLLPDGENTYSSTLLRTSVSSALIVMTRLPSGAPTNSTTVLMTSDAGQSWVQRPTPCLVWSVFLSQAPDGAIWLACASEPGAGMQLKSYERSFDDGVSWVQGPCALNITSPTLPPCLLSSNNSGYLGSFVATSSTTAFIAGGRNNVQVTHDGGATWQQTSPTIGDMDEGTGGLYFANSQDGWAIDAQDNPSAVLWRTTNGGVTWTQMSSAVPSLQRTPAVTVTPSVGLIGGQQVEVGVTGFGTGAKVWLSECASAADATDLGCGEQLAMQPFLVTGNSGSGWEPYTVGTSAYTKPYDLSDTAPCTHSCVIVATQGDGLGFAYAPISFGP